MPSYEGIGRVVTFILMWTGIMSTSFLVVVGIIYVLWGMKTLNELIKREKKSHNAPDKGVA